MAAQRWSVALLLAFLALGCGAEKPTLKPDPQELTVELGETKQITFHANVKLDADVLVTFNSSSKNIELSSGEFLLYSANNSGSVSVKGATVTSLTYLRIATCRYKDGSLDSECPLDISESTVHIKVVHSNALSIIIIVVGWMYFVAWSISFYPQIYLNFRRASVIGLNFDFLLLNIVGFTCYTIYNVLMYFDSYIQTLYHKEHVDSLNPVLLNDVVFASHALFACIVTAVQCFLYERGTQRVSYICIGLSSVFGLFAAVSVVLAIVDVFSWLQFINNLSYVKMAVTLCKYVPQAILNYRRKSTIGWSIGNVLLDFAGGSMDICQMVLQAVNTDDWSGFYGNPVKFGLGLVSIVFDVFFMVNDAIYEGINNSATSTTISQGNIEAGSAEGDRNDYGTNDSTIPVRDNNL
ncbi:hypothetical protein QR680_001549 [Steinernema hermaphroditum]|uniref:Cystinosin homolog n=1 Tax=Steinernema hermaphroditum TaxID=289476 RepID=A0AA39GYT1_9BILA|nr:hypothetical protein QR680_001549 [Steinernema hermaphroditum]